MLDQNLNDYTDNDKESVHDSEPKSKVLEELEKIVDTIKPNGTPFTVTLYKKNPFNGNPDQINKWREVIPPDSHEVGLMYGPGAYEYVLTYRDETNKTKRGRKVLPFNLGENYKALHKEYQESQQESKPTTVINDKSNDDMMKMMMFMMEQQNQRSQELFKTIATVGAALAPALLNRPQPPAPVESTSDKLLITLLPSLLDGKNKSQDQYFESLTNIFNKGIDMGQKNQTATEESNWKDVLMKVVENADKILPVPKALVRPKLKKDPNIQAMLQNPEQKQFFLSELEKKHGEETAQKIINHSGLENNPDTETKGVITL